MTIEEARNILKSLKEYYNDKNKDGYVGFDNEDNEAFDLAIKALETVSCIKEKCAYCPHCEYCDVDDETLEIKSLESQSWIPVSERLPEKRDYYLVTTKWKGSYSGDVYIETDMAVYREKQKEWDCVDVVAWMPLPEPYKGESEDKNDKI